MSENTQDPISMHGRLNQQCTQNIWGKYTKSKAYSKHWKVLGWLVFCFFFFFFVCDLWFKKKSVLKQELCRWQHSATVSCRINLFILLKLVGNKLDTPTTMSQLSANTIKGLEHPQVWVTARKPETNHGYYTMNVILFKLEMDFQKICRVRWKSRHQQNWQDKNPDCLTPAAQLSHKAESTPICKVQDWGTTVTYFLEMASKENGIRGFLNRLGFHPWKALLLKCCWSHRTTVRQIKRARELLSYRWKRERARTARKKESGSVNVQEGIEN